MKRVAFSTAVALLLATHPIFAQQVVETQRAMQAGINTAFTVLFQDTDHKLVKKTWKNFLQSRFDGRVKYDRKAKELVAEGTMVSGISQEPIDLHASVDRIGRHVELSLWVRMQDEFLRSANKPQQAREARFLLQDFSREVEREKIREELEQEERQFRKMERQYRKLQAAKARYERDIAQARERIERAEENIESNIIAQEEQQEALSVQMQRLEAVRERLNGIK